MPNKDTYFVMKNGVAIQPVIPQDGLELYYDVKGKKNTDNYKGTLLDMSGNGRHGTLSNFAYEGVSGYQENGTGGILLDDVDDKIVRPAISGIEYTSASRNLLNSLESEWESGTFSTLTANVVNVTRIRQINTYMVEPNVPHTISCATGYLVNVNVNGTGLNFAQSVSFTSTNGGAVRFVIKRTDDAPIAVSELMASKFQLEKGSVSTPYTPYIPLPIMTYQMNGNILSFEKDGTVKRITKDSEGNRVVKRIAITNLLKNDSWSIFGGAKMEEYVGGFVKIKGNGLTVYPSIKQQIQHKPNNGDVLLFRGKGVFDLSGFSTVRPLIVGGTAEINDVLFHQENNDYLCLLIYNTTANTNITFRVDTCYSTKELANEKNVSWENILLVNLSDVFGRGNEPTLSYIKSHLEEFEYTPNPDYLLQSLEIKNNLVGDLENLQGNDFEQHEDGVVTYTNEAEEGSVVRVDIDGISDQPLRFRNATGEQIVITEHDQVDADAIKKIEFQGNSVQLADKYREVSGTSVTIAPELHDKDVTDKLMIGGNTYQYTESSNVVTDGLEMWLSGRNFSNNPATTTWKDLTGVNNGTVSGFAYTTASGSDGNGGVVFDGVDDKITLPISANKYLITGKEYQPVTMEIWAKAYNTTGVATSLFGKLGNHTGFRFEGSNIIARAWDVEGLSATVQAPVALNTTFHAVATFNNKVVKLFVNGALIGQDTLLGNYRWLNGDFLINGTLNFNGIIYSARFYSKALTNAEVLQNYNAGLAIPIPNIAMPQEVKHVNSGNKVLVHGKNLLSPDNLEIGSISYSNGVNATMDSYVRMKNIIPVLPSTTYYINKDLRVCVFYDANGVYIGNYVGNGAGAFTTPVGCYGMRGRSYNAIDLNTAKTNAQLETGITATAYEPFKGYQETTIPVTLKSIG